MKSLFFLKTKKGPLNALSYFPSVHFTQKTLLLNSSLYTEIFTDELQNVRPAFCCLFPQHVFILELYKHVFLKVYYWF